MNGFNNGMLPGCGKLTVCEAGVENEGVENATDVIEGRLEESETNTVRSFSGQEVGARERGVR